MVADPLVLVVIVPVLLLPIIVPTLPLLLVIVVGEVSLMLMVVVVVVVLVVVVTWVFVALVPLLRESCCSSSTQCPTVGRGPPGEWMLDPSTEYTTFFPYFSRDPSGNL